MRIALFFLIQLIIFSNYSYSQQFSFSKEEVVSDLNYLKEKLLRYHPNLFVYSTSAEFDAFFLQTEKLLPDKMSSREAYRIFSKSSTVIKDGHTVFLPRIEPTNPFNTQNKFFPFQTYWDGESLFILKNYSRDQSLVGGEKILRINGRSAPELISEMSESLMRDGDNQTYPNWVLNTYFPEYFGYIYGYPAGFQLEMIDTSGNELNLQIKGLSKKDISSIQQFRYKKLQADNLLDIFFEREKNATIITLKSWDNKRMKEVYNKNFSILMREAFRQVFREKTENLILDLRGNQGGDIKNGKILLSHLLQEPFEIVEGFQKLNNQQELVACKGPESGKHKPNFKTFQGKVFVLIDGGSFSNTGIVSQALQKYKRATLIGEESGGSAYVLAGNVKNIVLPNTQVRVQIPQLRFTIQSDSPNGLHGVIPEYLIKPNIVDLVQQKDKALELAFDLIDK